MIPIMIVVVFKITVKLPLKLKKQMELPPGDNLKGWEQAHENRVPYNRPLHLGLLCSSRLDKLDHHHILEKEINTSLT